MVCIVFQGEWKEHFSGVRLLCRSEDPVMVCITGEKHKSSADIAGASFFLHYLHMSKAVRY